MNQLLLDEISSGGAGVEDYALRNYLISVGKTPPGTSHTPTVRRTLSGRRIDINSYPQTWHQLVEPPKPTQPRVRTGAWYDSLAALPKPMREVNCTCGRSMDSPEPCPHTGRVGEHISSKNVTGSNRTERRARGHRGSYARQLELRLGASLAPAEVTNGDE